MSITQDVRNLVLRREQARFYTRPLAIVFFPILGASLGAIIAYSANFSPLNGALLGAIASFFIPIIIHILVKKRIEKKLKELEMKYNRNVRLMFEQLDRGLQREFSKKIKEENLFYRLEKFYHHRLSFYKEYIYVARANENLGSWPIAID